MRAHVYFLISLSFAILVLPTSAVGWESDQFTRRLSPLVDSRDAMNAWVNDALAKVVDNWRPSNGRDPDLLAKRVFKALSSSIIVGKFEDWLTRSPEIDRLEFKNDHIYAGLPLKAVRGNIMFGACPTVEVGGIRVGTDKPGHFLSQGYGYYKIAIVRKKGEQAALAHGIRSESIYFGLMVAGVFSNADLVANYEGYRFYRSLYEDEVVPGKRAIFTWNGNRLVMQRSFDWSDHISEYWDEALLPSWFLPSLQKAVLPRLVRLCGDYWLDPQAFTPRHDSDLSARYSHLGLKYRRGNRLDLLCTVERDLLPRP
jgi:hypothetical protein